MRFESAAGTVAGAAHVRAGRNAQDGFAIASEGGVTVAVVTDGCGSAPHSEVGAKLGAPMVARALLRGDAGSILPNLNAIARTIGAPGFIGDYLLFTIVAAVVGPEETTVLAAGDGLYAINGVTRILGPFPDNAPPYLAYGNSELAVVDRRPTGEIESLLIATDGAVRIAGELAPFWTDDLVFRNPDAIRRRLFVRRKELDDDTTIVVLRRAEEPHSLLGPPASLPAGAAASCRRIRDAAG